ncbi:hypothetical protein BvCmsSINP010_04767 [Escherichia coli]|nr:hypothetical protein BvCmsSINP010_04767 [Escherichia coli]
MSDKVTVKQTINKATSIYKIEHITVGKPGSEQYRHAFELADQLGLKHPDCIEHVFPTYADEQCTHVLTEEDFFSTEEREGVDRCIGVICSSVSYELFPNVHENGGIGYQFLYEGDELKCYEQWSSYRKRRIIPFLPTGYVGRFFTYPHYPLGRSNN